MVRNFQPSTLKIQPAEGARLSPPSETTCYARHDDVASEPMGDELLLVQLVHGTTFRLNATGAWIWGLANEGMSIPEIVARLHPRLNVPAAQLEADVGALLEELVENGLLVRTLAERRRSIEPK